MEHRDRSGLTNAGITSNYFGDHTRIHQGNLYIQYPNHGELPIPASIIALYIYLTGWD